MKIDAYAHICPRKFIDAFARRAVDWETVARTSPIMGGPALWDVDKRLEVMDRYEDYVQVLVPSGEVVEPFFSPKDTAYLVKLFNDEVAELINKYPEKFVGAVAALPMNNIDAALKEIDRAINELGFKGVHIHTPVYMYEGGRRIELGYNYGTMKPIDSPEFLPIYDSMSKHNLPIWVHPVGQGGVPVYSSEVRCSYALDHIFGWPLESAMAMGRLVCSGILAKYPDLKFVIHHCGSGIVPALAGRIDNEFDKFWSTGLLKCGQPGEEDLFRNKSAVDYFRMFYGDTALYGDMAGLMCGYDFFGAEHILFGTDFPYDLASGDKWIRKTIDAIFRMPVSDIDKNRIFEGSAKRILRLDIE